MAQFYELDSNLGGGHPEPLLVAGINDGPPKDPPVDRDPAVVEWENAPIEIKSYGVGEVYFPDGRVNYRYRSGQRLIINGNEVMDTCEFPWAFETVKSAFDNIGINGTPPRVLEFGFGLGLTANCVIEQLVSRGGGEYHVVELNKQVHRRALEWKERLEEEFDRRGQRTGFKPDIKIFIYQGEAGEVAERFARRGRRFKMIISDTYPLRPEDTGLNDLKHLPLSSKCLTDGGVFACYVYAPGQEISNQEAEPEGVIAARQAEILYRYFDNLVLGKARVDPPPDYSYLQGKFGPIRWLPVAIGKSPKF